MLNFTTIKLADSANASDLAAVLRAEDNMFSLQGAYDLLSNMPAPVKWLFKDLIETELIAVLAGAGSVGKSLFSMQMGGCKAAGLPFLGKFAVESAGKVLYVSIEERRQKFHERFHELAYGLRHLNYIMGDEILWPDMYQKLSDNFSYKTLDTIPTALSLKRGEKFFDDLRRYRELIKPDLIVLDPLVYFLDDENSNAEVRDAFGNLLRDIATDGTTVLLDHHVSKAGMNGNSSGQGMARGASHIVLGAKWAGVISKDEYRRGVDIVKDNYNTGGPSQLPLKLTTIFDEHGKKSGWLWETDEVAQKQPKTRSKSGGGKCGLPDQM